ncbi:MAG: hypothetical protein KAT70_07480, partial [Thermoplasmata archaeon]|nr:hypothetical protein [Thermoplasmata archaeon]
MVKLGEIAGDKVHGAREICQRAVLYLGEHVRELEEDMPLNVARQKLADVALRLVEAQPTIASIFNLANNIMLAVEPAKST